jgi:hypothetical protein
MCNPPRKSFGEFQLEVSICSRNKCSSHRVNMSDFDSRTCSEGPTSAIASILVAAPFSGDLSLHWPRREDSGKTTARSTRKRAPLEILPALAVATIV